MRIDVMILGVMKVSLLAVTGRLQSSGVPESQHATDKGPETDRKRSGKSGNGRWRPETTGKYQTDMAEFGSKSQEAETFSDTSDEDSFVSRRMGLRQQVRSDVHTTAEGPAIDLKKPGNSGNGQRRLETTGKHHSSTAESGSKCRGTEAEMEMSK